MSSVVPRFVQLEQSGYTVTLSPRVAYVLASCERTYESGGNVFDKVFSIFKDTGHKASL